MERDAEHTANGRSSLQCRAQACKRAVFNPEWQASVRTVAAAGAGGAPPAEVHTALNVTILRVTCSTPSCSAIVR